MRAVGVKYGNDAKLEPPLLKIIEQLEISPSIIIKAEIVIEEMLLNIFAHGYCQKNSTVYLRAYTTKQKFYLFIYDNAPKFNIFAVTSNKLEPQIHELDSDTLAVDGDTYHPPAISTYSSMAALSVVNLADISHRGNGNKLIKGLISSYRYRFSRGTNINLLIFNLL